MNKRFIRVAVFCALTATAAPVFVGCSDDYDADITGLQDQINKINGVVGITGDDMAAAIDEVVEQLQTKIDSLGGIVSDKVNVDELTASVNNLNQLIDQKADASQIQAEADRLQGLIDAANEAAAGANEELSQKLEQQISDLEKKQEEAQQKLNDALNGKVDPATLQAEAARLEGLINEAKKIAEGAVTSAQLDEKISTVEGEIESLESKLNSAATSEGVASQIEAAKQELQLLIDAKADPATIDEKIAAYNETLQATLDGKASATLVAGLRGEVTNLTGSVKDLQNELKRIDDLETSLGTALSDLSSVKSDLSGLKSRIEALEGADLNLSEYAEFSALVNRVQAVEDKWGELSSTDIENNKSAIEEINDKLDAFFADKADATAKDIYDKLKALEDWKADVVDEIASISSKANQSDLQTALDDIDDLKTQLGLITSQDPDDPEQGGDTEEPTANFYNKEEIDKKFNAVEERMVSLLGNFIQSMVYIPDFANGDAHGGLSFQTLTVKPISLTTPVAQRTGQVIKFRIAPAAAATKENIENNYKLTFDGQQMRAGTPSGFETELVGADPTTGIVTYDVKSGTLSDQMWALCAMLKANEPKEGETKTNFTDITSDYFTVTYETQIIDAIRTTCSVQSETNIAYKSNATEDPTELNYTNGRKYVGYYNGTKVADDMGKTYGDIFETKYELAKESVNPNSFKLVDGKLSAAASSSEYIGHSAIVVATTKVKGYNTWGGTPTSYSKVTISDVSYRNDLTLTGDFIGTTDPTEWNQNAQTFTIDAGKQATILEQVGMNHAEFFGNVMTSANYTNGGLTAEIKYDPNTNRIIVTYPGGMVISGTEPQRTITLTVNLPGTTGRTRTSVINVVLPATATYPKTQSFTQDMNLWETATMARFYPTYERVNGRINSISWEMSLEGLFDDYTGTAGEITGDGGSVTWSALQPTGATFDGKTHKITLDNTYNVHRVNDNKLGFGVTIHYGVKTYPQSFDIAIQDISGTWTKGATRVELKDRNDELDLAKGYKWADKDGNVIWADGAVASFGTKDDAYERNPFDVLGLSTPVFTLDASAGHDKYATITPDGKLSLTETGKNWLSGKNVVLKVKVYVYSRFGSVQGYNANDVIEVPVTF